MRRKKFDQIYRDLSNTAKKVYDAVPIQQPWSLHEIYAEMGRKGVSPNYVTVEACVKQMFEQGIVKRTADMTYIREPVVDPMHDHPAFMKQVNHQPPEKTMTHPDVPKPPIKPPVLKADPMDILSALANRTENMKLDLSNMVDRMNQLQQDIETAAITVADTIQNNSQELAELRQMQASLKKFLGG